MKDTRSGRPAASFGAHLMSLATAVPSHCVHQSTVAASARLRDRCFAGTRFRCTNVRWSGATCGSPGSVTFRPPELLPVGGDVKLAFLLCERCLPPWYINHIPVDRPPWTIDNWPAGDRFRCPGCGGAVRWHVHGRTWRPFGRQPSSSRPSHLMAPSRCAVGRDAP